MWRVVAGILVTLLLLLQVRLWFSPDGLRGVAQLRTQVEAQQAENAQLTERNRRLDAEVADLRQGFSALEERARSDLGLVGANETFFIYADKRGAPAGADER
ncbi:MAG: cell division protein FtsB [Gammaproteobacteria bacterium]|nr:cell division protein FtsB [Gammaproteobacteria bacterium]